MNSKPTPIWPDAVRLGHSRAVIEADLDNALPAEATRNMRRYVSMDFVVAVLTDTVTIDEETQIKIVDALE